MKRGEIYYIESDIYSAEGLERKNRPAVIVSGDRFLDKIGTVQICFLTTSPYNDLPTHVTTRSAPKPSTILCEQVRTISSAKLGECVGRLTENELLAVDDALAISLGLDFGRMVPEVVEKRVEVEKVVPQELTEEEKDQIFAERWSKAMQSMTFQVKPEEIEMGDRLARAEAERDVYRGLYDQLLAKVLGDDGRGK